MQRHLAVTLPKVQPAQEVGRPSSRPPAKALLGWIASCPQPPPHLGSWTQHAPPQGSPVSNPHPLPPEPSRLSRIPHRSPSPPAAPGPFKWAKLWRRRRRRRRRVSQVPAGEAGARQWTRVRRREAGRGGGLGPQAGRGTGDSASPHCLAQPSSIQRTGHRLPWGASAGGLPTPCGAPGS
jgi:hypothetical protein